MILKVINLTHSLIKNLAIVGILDLRLTHEPLRPLLISASAHQAYCIYFLKLTNRNLATGNCLTIALPFMLTIFRHLLRLFKDILVVLFIPINLFLRSSSCAKMNHMLRLVIHYVILLKQSAFQLLSILKIITILRKVFSNAFFGNVVSGDHMQNLIPYGIIEPIQR